MDKATLVESDVEISALVLDALSRTRMPVTFCGWRWVPELEEQQLIVATPWIDTKGPLTTYQTVIDALTKAGVYEDVPMRRVFLMSPKNPVVQELKEEAKSRNEGFIHILRHSGSRNRDEYSIRFAPVPGSGFVRSKVFTGQERLRDFLTGRLHLHQTAIDDAFKEVGDKGRASIFPVYLTTQDVRKLGLA